jgi:hypothetical protein
MNKSNREKRLQSVRPDVFSPNGGWKKGRERCAYIAIGNKIYQRIFRGKILIFEKIKNKNKIQFGCRGGRRSDMDLPIDDNNNHHLILRPSQSIYIHTNESGNKKYAAAGYGPVHANPFDKKGRFF